MSSLLVGAAFLVGALSNLILPISLGVMLVATSVAAMGVWSLATQIPLLFNRAPTF